MITAILSDGEQISVLFYHDPRKRKVSATLCAYPTSNQQEVVVGEVSVKATTKTNPPDPYIPDVGRRKALEKLLTNRYPRQDRSIIWQAYNEKYPILSRPTEKELRSIIRRVFPYVEAYEDQESAALSEEIRATDIL